MSVLSVLLFTTLISATPTNSESHKPHEFIIAKTDSKNRSGKHKYKKIEIVPVENDLSSKNQSTKMTEAATASVQVQEPEYKEYDEKPFSEPQKQEFERILKAIKVAEPEEQKYNEQNPQTETEKLSDPGNAMKQIGILKTAKPEDEKNSEPVNEKLNQTNERNLATTQEDQQYEPQYTQDIITRVTDQTHKGPSYASFIQIQPDSETLKHYSQIAGTQKPAFEDSGRPIDEERQEPKYIVPEAPKFTTRISVPPLPISLSSIRYLKVNWPHEVPLIFKAPKIIYLVHH